MRIQKNFALLVAFYKNRIESKCLQYRLWFIYNPISMWFKKKRPYWIDNILLLWYIQDNILYLCSTPNIKRVNIFIYVTSHWCVEWGYSCITRQPVSYDSNYLKHLGIIAGYTCSEWSYLQQTCECLDFILNYKGIILCKINLVDYFPINKIIFNSPEMLNTLL